jgi:DUF1365 family protein
MQSALYTGRLSHRRFAPVAHAFRYRVTLCWIDLSELESVFRGRWLWSVRRPAVAWLRRADYLGDPRVPLDEAVRDLVEQRTGTRPAGPIRLLTQLRTFGFCFNPVSFYYCYDAADTHVETIVAEITNTPWKERHAYVLPVEEAMRGGRALQFEFDKSFHVSPFMPMDVQYDWRFSTPGDALLVHMKNFRAGARTFDATLTMSRRAIGSASLAAALLQFPAMTAQVTGAIYWQALKLLLKRTPFFTHPGKQPLPQPTTNKTT